MRARSHVRRSRVVNTILFTLYVPPSVEPVIEKFFGDIASSCKPFLNVKILTTYPNSNIWQASSIDYSPTVLCAEPFVAKLPPASLTDFLTSQLSLWAEHHWPGDPYGIEHLRKIYRFFENEVDQSENMSAIFTWQSQSLYSTLLRSIATDRGIPFYSVERGWLPHTLMVDIGRNTFFSETNLSFIKREAPTLTEKERAQFQVNMSLRNCDRYEDINTKSSKPQPNKVVFFNHGEPHFSFAGNAQQRLAHHHNLSQIGTIVETVNNYCLKNQLNFAVQEHPFNREGLFNLSSVYPNICNSNESVKEIFESQHTSLFTHSTLQFQSVLSGCKTALLSRGPLSGWIPELQHHSSVEKFLNHFLKTPAESYLNPAVDYIYDLYKKFLIDIEPTSYEQSVNVFSKKIRNLFQ